MCYTLLRYAERLSSTLRRFKWKYYGIMSVVNSSAVFEIFLFEDVVADILHNSESSCCEPWATREPSSDFNCKVNDSSLLAVRLKYDTDRQCDSLGASLPPLLLSCPPTNAAIEINLAWTQVRGRTFPTVPLQPMAALVTETTHCYCPMWLC